MTNTTTTTTTTTQPQSTTRQFHPDLSASTMTFENLLQDLSFYQNEFQNDPSTTSAELPDLVRVLPCLHSFHSSCIGSWLLYKAVCPICRTHPIVCTSIAEYATNCYISFDINAVETLPDFTETATTTATTTTTNKNPTNNALLDANRINHGTTLRTEKKQNDDNNNGTCFEDGDANAIITPRISRNSALVTSIPLDFIATIVSPTLLIDVGLLPTLDDEMVANTNPSSIKFSDTTTTTTTTNLKNTSLNLFSPQTNSDHLTLDSPTKYNRLRELSKPLWHEFVRKFLTNTSYNHLNIHQSGHLLPYGILGTHKQHTKPMKRGGNAVGKLMDYNTKIINPRHFNPDGTSTLDYGLIPSHQKHQIDDVFHFEPIDGSFVCTIIRDNINRIDRTTQFDLSDPKHAFFHISYQELAPSMVRRLRRHMSLNLIEIGGTTALNDGYHGGGEGNNNSSSSNSSATNNNNNVSQGNAIPTITTTITTTSAIQNATNNASNQSHDVETNNSYNNNNNPSSSSLPPVPQLPDQPPPPPTTPPPPILYDPKWDNEPPKVTFKHNSLPDLCMIWKKMLIKVQFVHKKQVQEATRMKHATFGRTGSLANIKGVKGIKGSGINNSHSQHQLSLHPSFQQQQQHQQQRSNHSTNGNSMSTGSPFLPTNSINKNGNATTTTTTTTSQPPQQQPQSPSQLIPLLYQDYGYVLHRARVLQCYYLRQQHDWLLGRLTSWIRFYLSYYSQFITAINPLLTASILAPNITKNGQDNDDDGAKEEEVTSPKSTSRWRKSPKSKKQKAGKQKQKQPQPPPPSPPGPTYPEMGSIIESFCIQHMYILNQIYLRTKMGTNMAATLFSPPPQQSQSTLHPQEHQQSPQLPPPFTTLFNLKPATIFAHRINTLLTQFQNNNNDNNNHNLTSPRPPQPQHQQQHISSSQGLGIQVRSDSTLEPLPEYKDNNSNNNNNIKIKAPRLSSLDGMETTYLASTPTAITDSSNSTILKGQGSAIAPISPADNAMTTTTTSTATNHLTEFNKQPSTIAETQCDPNSNSSLEDKSGGHVLGP